jgi:hypothetical protein
MVLKRFIDKDNFEHALHESTNVYYSKASLNTRDSVTNIGGVSVPSRVTDVEIVFNRGARYNYPNVEWHDYQAFIEMLNSADPQSSGKAFNKFIKTYTFEKKEDADLSKLVKLVEQENGKIEDNGSHD